MFKMVFYVPEPQKEEVKEALFDLGAGTLGNYSSCCWECEGMGQFKPLTGSNPVIGTVDSLERIKEFRVEILVTEDLISSCIDTLKAVHPYEVPAYEFHRVYLKETDIEGEHWL